MAVVDYQSGPSRPRRCSQEPNTEWVTPVIMLGVASVIFIAIHFIWGGAAFAAGAGIGFLVVVLINAVAGTLAGYLSAFLLKIGFGTFWMAVLRIAAVVTLAQAFAFLVPICIFPLIIYFASLVAMSMILFDLGRGEAVGFAFIVTVVNIAISIALTLAAGA